MEKAFIVQPPNFGWLQAQLSKNEIDFLWECIDNKKELMSNKLAGNISSSFLLDDKDNWFFDNVLGSVVSTYIEQYPTIVKHHQQFDNLHPLVLDKLWVNYQKQNEFNPLHDHNGVYSFVVWMKIPTRHSEQNKNPIAMRSGDPRISTFVIRYLNTLGKLSECVYEMNPEMEGIMLFFNSTLMHGVNPFYDCDEDRISISGNVAINTKELL